MQFKMAFKSHSTGTREQFQTGCCNAECSLSPNVFLVPCIRDVKTLQTKEKNVRNVKA